MSIGIAGALLVFTGGWHATEWMMDGRRRDTLVLVPIGLIYLLFGWRLVTSTGGTAVAIAAMISVAVGGSLAFFRRKQLSIRSWVVWAFIVIDVAIFAALLVFVAD